MSIKDNSFDIIRLEELFPCRARFYTSFMEIEIIGEELGSSSPRNSIFSDRGV